MATDKELAPHSTEPLLSGDNKIGDFRPNRGKGLNISDGALQNADTDDNKSPTASMETRMLTKEKKRSIINNNDPAFEQVKGGCCSGNQCQIF